MTKEEKEQKLMNIYEYIKNYTIVNKYPPSYREISKTTGVKSTNSVKDYIEKLVERGLIKVTKSKNRCIEVTDIKSEACYGNGASGSSLLVDIPLIGRVAAGTPILAEQNIEDHFIISKSIFNTNQELFLLRVHGDSMINIGISDSDLVVVKSQNTAENGEIVVAMIDGAATVKNFYKEKDCIRLQPQNDLFRPIIVKDVQILGKVIGVIKYF